MFNQIGHDRTMFKYDEFKYKQISEFDREHFCDFIHKTKKGHELSAKIVLREANFRNYKKIWFFGGSTMEGRDCDGAYLSMTDIIKEKTEAEVTNFGRGGKGSDYSIIKLEKLLLEGKKVDLVVWGHWINEIFLRGDSSDLNFKVLNEEFKLKGQSNVQLMEFFARLNVTLYKKSSFFRLIVNIILDLSSKFSLEMFERTHRDKAEGILIGRELGKNPDLWIKYAVKNSNINLNRLVELSRRHQFKVIVLFMPRIENYYMNSRPALNDFLESWYRTIKDILSRYSNVNDWLFIDLHKDFKKVKEGFGEDLIQN